MIRIVDTQKLENQIWKLLSESSIDLTSMDLEWNDPMYQQLALRLQPELELTALEGLMV